MLSNVDQEVLFSKKVFSAAIFSFLAKTEKTSKLEKQELMVKSESFREKKFAFFENPSLEKSGGAKQSGCSRRLVMKSLNSNKKPQGILSKSFLQSNQLFSLPSMFYFRLLFLSKT